MQEGCLCNGIARRAYVQGTRLYQMNAIKVENNNIKNGGSTPNCIKIIYTCIQKVVGYFTTTYFSNVTQSKVHNTALFDFTMTLEEFCQKVAMWQRVLHPALPTHSGTT
jgi:hypothetical protein